MGLRESWDGPCPAAKAHARTAAAAGDQLAEEIRATFPAGASNLVKFKALRDYLYRPPLLSRRQPYLCNLYDDRNSRAKRSASGSAVSIFTSSLQLASLWARSFGHETAAFFRRHSK